MDDRNEEEQPGYELHHPHFGGGGTEGLGEWDVTQWRERDESKEEGCP